MSINEISEEISISERKRRRKNRAWKNIKRGKCQSMSKKGERRKLIGRNIEMANERNGNRNQWMIYSYRKKERKCQSKKK